jgi:hypothetical protein
MELSGGEKEVIAYLLGDLNASERDALNVRISKEPSFAEAVMAIEDDLLIEYARGGLSGPTRARIEGAYSETPARRARLEAAYALLDSIARTPAAQPRPRKVARRTGYIIASLLAAAALVFAVWLPSRKYLESPHIASDASFELEAGQTRSGGGRQIALPAGARAIEFRLRLQDRSDFRNWRVSLGTVEHPESWSGPASLRDRLVVTVVPASVLAPGDYTLTLFGGDASGTMPERATYYFRVE